MTDQERVWETLLAEGFGDDLRSRATDWVFGFGPALQAVGIDLTNPALNERIRLLDYGCGQGGLARFAKAVLGVGRVSGVDTSPTAIAAARQRDANVDFQLLADGRELPYPAESFDACIACFVLCTMGRTEQQLLALRRIRRCLRPAGRVALVANDPEAAGTRFAGILVEDSGVNRREGRLARVRLFRLAEEEPYLQFDDYIWSPNHYVRLLEEARFGDVRFFRPTWQMVRRFAEDKLGLPTNVFTKEHCRPPLLVHTATRESVSTQP